MKNIIFNIVAILLAVLVFTGCEKDKPDYTYGGPWFISFAYDADEISEGSEESLKIEVLLASPVQEGTVTVDFTVTSENAVEGTDFEVLNANKQIVFQAGEGSAFIEIRAINNSTPEDNKELTITLTDNSAGFVLGLPGPDENNKSFKVKILDDDSM